MGNKFELGQEVLAEEWMKRRETEEKRICKECGNEGHLKQFGGRVIKHMTFLHRNKRFAYTGMSFAYEKIAASVFFFGCPR